MRAEEKRPLTLCEGAKRPAASAHERPRAPASARERPRAERRARRPRAERRRRSRRRRRRRRSRRRRRHSLGLAAAPVHERVHRAHHGGGARVLAHPAVESVAGEGTLRRKQLARRGEEHRLAQRRGGRVCDASRSLRRGTTRKSERRGARAAAAAAFGSTVRVQGLWVFQRKTRTAGRRWGGRAATFPCPAAL